MTKKRFEIHSMIAGMDIGETMDLEVCESLIKKYGSSADIDSLITDNGKNMTYQEVCDLLNNLNEYVEENERLKQDNNALIHLLENQSMIIQELHSKLLEPIVLTKEDLELMDKAVSYYTHGRCVE